MAGDWLKVEVETPEKPEVFAIASSLGLADPDLAFAKLFKIWRWFDRHTLNGNAPCVSLALLDHVVGVSGFAQAMKNVGWLIESESGVVLPNFDNHNGKTAKTRALTARRVKNHSEKGEKTNAVVVSPSLVGALPREDNREEKNTEKESAPAPSGSPRRGKAILPPPDLPFPSATFLAKWEEWERHLKEKRSPLTPTARAKQIKQLSPLSESHAIATIDTAITRNWRGLFPESSKPTDRNAGTLNAGRPIRNTTDGGMAGHDRPDGSGGDDEDPFPLLGFKELPGTGAQGHAG